MSRLARILTLVLILGALLATAMPVDAKPGKRNNENAKACQKGGYATLATSGDPHTAFTTEEACVNYAAQGGDLAPVIQTSLTITSIGPTTVEVTGSGLLPFSGIDLILWKGDTVVFTFNDILTADVDGNIVSGALQIGNCGFEVTGISAGATSAGGATVNSSVVGFSCLP